MSKQEVMMKLACKVGYLGKDQETLLKAVRDTYKEAGQSTSLKHVAEEIEKDNIRRHSEHSVAVTVNNMDYVILGALV